MNPMIYMGVQVSNGKHPFAYAAINTERRLVAIGQGAIEEVLFFAAGQDQAVVAVNAPQHPAQKQVETSSNAGKGPARPAEHQIRAKGIAIPATPVEGGRLTAWMRSGFNLYQQLKALQYVPFGQPDCHRLYMETNAGAIYHALLGLEPFTGGTLESRLQRQLVLFEAQMPVHDPFLFFEELTRHKLLQGILPLKDILAHTELDALAAAYLAWLAVTKPERVTAFGDEQDGPIYLPSHL